ncbi:hypothetical protein K2173_023408 [Erythroxylum novogranatense]|uniref:DUF4283 domain-containing protein n=1 Tax=Erythroxylum novogranatense TaxID=1862640 RepID=A0AAV8TY67_9ROSI|nr:hypothetical protein K2173_023408 [Erythroxylum novogranatense]
MRPFPPLPSPLPGPLVVAPTVAPALQTSTGSPLPGPLVVAPTVTPALQTSTGSPSSPGAQRAPVATPSSPDDQRAPVATSVQASPSSGSWRDTIAARRHRGQLTHHPHVLQDGVISPPIDLLRAGAKTWSNALFSSHVAVTEILELGPWHVGDQPMFLRQWQPGMGLDKSSVEVIPIWAQFHGLPLEYWTLEGLSHLASGIGKPICLDSQTAAMDRIGYAKICIEVPKAAVLPDKVCIRRLAADGELVCASIPVTYPWKPSADRTQWVPTGRRFSSGWSEDLDSPLPLSAPAQVCQGATEDGLSVAVARDSPGRPSNVIDCGPPVGNSSSPCAMPMDTSPGRPSNVIDCGPPVGNSSSPCVMPMNPCSVDHMDRAVECSVVYRDLPCSSGFFPDAMVLDLFPRTPTSLVRVQLLKRQPERRSLRG